MTKTKPTTKLPRGRPANPDGRHSRWPIQLTAAERETIIGRAEAARMPVAEYLRAWAIGGPCLLARVGRLLDIVDESSDPLTIEVVASVRAEVRHVPAIEQSP